MVDLKGGSREEGGPCGHSSEGKVAQNYLAFSLRDPLLVKSDLRKGK